MKRWFQRAEHCNKGREVASLSGNAIFTKTEMYITFPLGLIDDVETPSMCRGKKSIRYPIKKDIIR